MLQLAEQYAALKNTKVLDHRINGKEITFVLESGPKLTLTEAQLKTAIAKIESEVGTVGATDEQVAPLTNPAQGAVKKTKKEK